MQTRTTVRRSLRPRRPRGSDARRGVILLVVLAMLTIFTLIGLTLVVVATQARMASLASLRAQADATEPDDLLRRAWLDVARGSLNSSSPIQAHSIVEDLYGAPLLTGTIIPIPGGSPIVSTQGGQVLLMQVQADAGQFFSPASFAYAGLVMTITNSDSPAAFRSSRIIASYNAPALAGLGATMGAYPALVVMPSDGFEPKPNDRFVINGRPFSGTGFGYGWINAANMLTNGVPAVPAGTTPPLNTPAGTLPIPGTSGPPLLSAFDPSGPSPNPLANPTGIPVWYYALLPNHSQITLQPSGPGAYSDPGGPQGTLPGILVGAGANEPWDAPDYQNTFLAAHFFSGGIAVTPLPSFHRPELIQYWMNAYQTAGAWTPPSGGAGTGAYKYLPIDWYNPLFPTASALPGFSQQTTPVLGGPPGPGAPADLARRICLRPLLVNNYQDLANAGVYQVADPAFTGGNANKVVINGVAYPLFDPLNGPWDVDNDGDGLTDSIWIDLGYEPERSPDGKLYKPLFAFLIVDMDGKLNINAHGTLAHLDPARAPGSNVFTPYALVGANAGTGIPGTVQTYGASGRNVVFGQHYGPPEINLLPLLARTPPGYSSTLTPLQQYTQLLQGANLSFGQIQLPFLSTLLPALFAAPSTAFVHGRNGEVDDSYLVITTNAVNYPGNAYLFAGPAPGRSRQFDPFTLASSAGSIFQINNPVNQTRDAAYRPFLIYSLQQQALNTQGYFFDFVTSALQPTAGTHVPTSCGTFYDLHGRAAVMLDLRGQVYPTSTANLPAMASLQDPISLQYISDTADDPYQLNLFRKAQNDGAQMALNAGGNPLITAPDQPFMPEEGERVWRAHDSDASSLASRLPTLAPSLLTGYQRQSFTTDSWSIPVPQVTATGFEQSQVDVFNYETSLTTASIYTYLQSQYPGLAPSVVPPMQGGMSVADLARARILARNSATWVGTPQLKFAYADLALFGSQLLGAPTFVQPLLSFDTTMGLKLDINRLLGNGQDDPSPPVATPANATPVIQLLGNGVVDEPFELYTSGEVMTYPLSSIVLDTLGQVPPPLGAANVPLDLNNDGLLPAFNTYAGNLLIAPPGNAIDATNSDYRVRQLLARHLYCLMMLLIDDQYVQAQMYQSLATVPAAYNYYASNAANQALLTNPPNTTALANGTLQAFNMQAAYLVAQWAINAVDFRDADSIMTPFEFDVNPFVDDDGNPLNGTWDVDDVITPALSAHYGTPQFLLPTGFAGSADDVAAWRGLVWGCERPELLITETIATHDRGTADTAQAGNLIGLQTNQGNGADTTAQAVGTANSDWDWDQVRRPRGTLAVELFNPSSPADAPIGGVDPAIGAGRSVNLTALSPVDAATAMQSPVWRLAVVYSPLGYDQFINAAATPGSILVDPRIPTLPAAYINRVVYFAGAAGAVNTGEIVNANQLFFPNQTILSGAQVLVAPNSYALVAPGEQDLNNPGLVGTYLGLRNQGSDTATKKFNLYPIYLQTTPVGAGLFNASGAVGAAPAISPYIGTSAAVNTGTTYNIKPVVALPIGPSILGANTLRMSISEPANGYPEPPAALTTGSVAWSDNFYYPSAGNPYYQEPFDSYCNQNGIVPNPAVAPDGTNPIGTILDYTTVYLQRLANPLAPWDLYANPYITVDSMPVDLTSYTGESANNEPNSTYPPSAEQTYLAPKMAPAGALAAAALLAPVPGYFDARQRGTVPAAGQLDAPNLWAVGTTGPGAATFGAPTSLTNPLPYSTLGYLNQTYWVNPQAGTFMGNVPNNVAVGAGLQTVAMGFYTPPGATPTQWQTQLQAASATTGIPATQYYGDPLVPFPWFTWNDRPYANQHELMLVPTSSPSTLLSDFGLLYYASGGIGSPPSGIGTALSITPYNMLTPATGSGTVTLPFAPFPHLLNFYDSTGVTAEPNQRAGATPSLPAFDWYRIFEYVNVPSRFTGAQALLHPLNFQPASSPPHPFHPPFNWASQYREPGRINLNTVFDPQVFEGLMDDFPGWNTLMNNLFQARQGYVSATIPPVNPNYPTMFVNPFRPEGAGVLTPPSNTPANQFYQSLGQAINTTLFRPMAPGSYPGNATATAPLLDATSFDATNMGANYSVLSTPVTSNNQQYRHAGRNSYFQYQAHQRLGNLVTNQSNVYATWITVGYFEVTPTAVSTAHPDGYMLGQEVGTDTGKTQRHRAFFLFDRSIPIGFQRGQDLNVEDGLLIERMIE